MEKNKRTERIEIGDIFRLYLDAYLKVNKVSPRVEKIMRNIASCRTAELGGHVEECDNCGHIRISYNSCRDRHCPKCQGLYREKWLMKEKRNLLPVGYFHIVFTIPEELNAIALINQDVVYNILFKSATETLIKLGLDEKWLGGYIGMMAMLHTWSQTIAYHPHLHCIVPCGGLSKDLTSWILPKKSKNKNGTKKNKFFVHVDVISKMFRGKFLYYLKKAYKEGKLKFSGRIEYLENEIAFGDLLNVLYNKKWVTYCKRPFGSVENVINYLGRYTHRVAISNSRIIKLEDDKVTFEYRDYKDGDKLKEMTLGVFEFIRRFLLHILPKGFMKIRHYGIFSNKSRKTKLKKAKELLGVNVEDNTESKVDWKELYLKNAGIEIDVCPECKKGKMILKETLKALNKNNKRTSARANIGLKPMIRSP
jgi:hypothetical protein